MRKLLLLAFVGLLVFTVLRAEPSRMPAGVRAVVGGVTLPFKLAALSVREADQTLVVPVEGIRIKQIADTWHAPRPGGRLHEGQDIFAQRGTPVRSATAGYVVRVGENELGGKVVFVIGAGGRSYYYAHLDAHAEELQVGDKVTPETVLGYVGTTGNAAGTPPHLHFGVYAPGSAVDPLPLLVERHQDRPAETSAAE